MEQYCFGVDVGGTSIKCGLFKPDGEIVEKWEIPTRTADHGKAILPDTAATLKQMINKHKLDKAALIGTGIGVPGPVTEAGTVDVAVNIGWEYKDIVGELSGYLNHPIKAGNDANVAALGEMWLGGGGGSRNMILVTLGTGVGGGIIVDGKIVTGAHGAGGEIGHARVDWDDTIVCNCGNSGCLEQKASATGIVRLAREAIETATGQSLLKSDKLSAKAVFDAYKKNDPLAISVVEKFAAYLGNALAIYSTVVDPEVIVIGGGVSKAGQKLIEVVKKYYQRDAFSACKKTDIVLARLGNDAGICGAAKLILDCRGND